MTVFSVILLSLSLVGWVVDLLTFREHMRKVRQHQIRRMLVFSRTALYLAPFLCRRVTAMLRPVGNAENSEGKSPK